MGQVNLKSLSNHLGLTQSTVSRALNGYTDIAPATRARVQAAADTLDYRPHVNARRLAIGSAECVAYILPGQNSHISDPFLMEILDGLSQTLSKRHWDLVISAAPTAQDECAILQRFARSNRANGLVISHTLTDDPRVNTLQKLNIPFITHGRTRNDANHAWFDVDNYAAFYHTTSHLLALGHRRIAHIHGAIEYNFSRLRQAGYRAALGAHKITIDPALEVPSDLTIKGGEQAMRKLLRIENPPTALVCVSDMVALGAMRTIQDNNLVPGRDLSIIGYGGLPVGEFARPALTTMAQPLQTAGQQLGRMLLAIIDGEDPIHHQILEPAYLVRRETDVPPR